MVVKSQLRSGLRRRAPVKSDKDLRLSTPVKSEKDLGLRNIDGQVGQRTKKSCRQLLAERSEVDISDTGSGGNENVANLVAAVKDLVAKQNLRGFRTPSSRTKQAQQRARLVRLTGGLVEERWLTSIRRH